MKRLLTILCVASIMLSCNMDDIIDDSLSAQPPRIILDSETGVYTVKAGREILLAPSYESVENAVYEWTIDGRIVCREPSMRFCSDEEGETFVTLRVATSAGEDTEDLRIDVVALEIPSVSIAAPENGYTIAKGSTLNLRASVRKTTLATECEWSLNGVVLSRTENCVFEAAEEGAYDLVFTARNDDGSDSLTCPVRVCKPEDMPFSWLFSQTVCNVSLGRSILLRPDQIENGANAVYAWSVNGVTVEGAAEPRYVFEAQAEGVYEVTAEAKVEREGEAFTLTHTVTVNVCPREGTYRRAKTEASSADLTCVFEYTPAPGQFINETRSGGFDGSETTPEAAAAYAMRRMESSSWVSLGGFGGYVVVGFDHSIDNAEGYDFAIMGNSFEGSSEPGIVWVMQDENGNSLPDDTWYELRGCETGAENTVQDYAVTYYRPTGAGMPVQWTDNLGNSGEVDYLKAFHTQDFYYPAWIATDTYTLRGTRLEARNYDKSGNGSFWVQPEYEWGYADNFSPIDRLTDDDNASAKSNANHFDISNAMRFDCETVDLAYIDFIKVQTALNTKSGWLGESSVEVCGFYDYSLKKTAGK